ncbi:hypothetical protein CTI12_AA536590 [Artemisia annua]|uniref:CCHC-type domain-containing protein n=1 Tax=Artemisia annua TaxID=35608 RepID=A0A2U1L2Y0_ARTAN|nr:hypothetical protein CTI12_AA536590 [Artemisia annua]
MTIYKRTVLTAPFIPSLWELGKLLRTHRYIPFIDTTRIRLSEVREELLNWAIILKENTLGLKDLILEKEKLNGNNFLDWYRNLRIVLRAEQKFYHLEEALPEAPADNATVAVRNAYNRRKNEQQEVACLMLASMIPELQKNLENLAAFDMLRELKVMFEHQAEQELFDTVRSFHACKQEEGQSVKKGFPKKAPVVQAINQGRIQKKNKGKPLAPGKGQGKGKAQHAYAPKPKIPPPAKKEHPAKDTVCHHCGVVGHWRRNCAAYLEGLKKNKASGASTSGGGGDTLDGGDIFDLGHDTRLKKKVRIGELIKSQEVYPCSRDQAQGHHTRSKPVHDQAERKPIPPFLSTRLHHDHTPFDPEINHAQIHLRITSTALTIATLFEQHNIMNRTLIRTMPRPPLHTLTGRFGEEDGTGGGVAAVCVLIGLGFCGLESFVKNMCRVINVILVKYTNEMRVFKKKKMMILWDSVITKTCERVYFKKEGSLSLGGF